MKFNKIDKIVLLMVCITLVVGLITIYQRIGIEKQYKTAEIVLDFDEMEKFSESSDENLNWWLEQFKEYGAQSVAIQEETINKLIEDGNPLKAEIISEVIKKYNWEDSYSSEIVSLIKEGSIGSNDAIVTTKDRELFNYLLSRIEERYPDEFYNTYFGNNDYYITLKGTNDDLYYGQTEIAYNLEGEGISETKKIVDSRLLNIGVGYDDEKIKLVKSVGLDVVLRPINFPTYNEKLADAYKMANEKYGIEPRLYIANGKEILGYPDNGDKLLNYINDEDISIVLIESSVQREHLEIDGMNDLVENSGYNALRAFTMWDYIRARNKYYNYEGAEEIENTMFRAITERNIRVIYFKPFFEGENTTKFLTDAEEYERTFESLENRLEEHNIVLGKAESMNEFHISTKRLAVLAFGITLASVFLFIKMFKIKHSFVNYLYLLAIPGALLPLVIRNIAEKGFAFIAAVVFSGIGIYFFMMQIKKIYDSEKEYSKINIITRSILILTGVVLIALTGAVFLDGMLADVKYMLEMDIFRGVKLAQILPFGIFIIMYLIYFVNKDEKNPVKSVIDISIKIMNKEIKIYYGIVVGILGIIGYVYISRTGNESSLQPSNIEMISRNFMEYVLLARPRTKEFLIAFPAMFAAVYAANKKSKFFTGIFMMAAVIGTSSVINTFSHLRTPIYLSFARTVIALGLGIVIGCVAIVFIDLIYQLFVKIQERLQW